MRRYSIVTIMVFAFVSTVQAAVWYVHPDSTLNSIQTALNLCSAGDTVLVGPGTYYESILWPSTSGIDLISELGPDTTIIDGSGSNRVMVISSGVDSSTNLSGFTIQNGWGSYSGGALWCTGSSPNIIGNIFTDNASWNGGGAIDCGNSSAPLIHQNVFINNHSKYGGAIVMGYSSTPYLTENTFTANSADSGGGALAIAYDCDPIVANNTISNNTSNHYGGGILIGYSSGTFLSNIITNNSAAEAGGGIACTLSTATFDQCTITGNHAAIRGGGIYTAGSNVIMDCIVSDNTCDGDGAGIFCIYSTDTIVGNIVEDNVAADDGGGLMISEGSAPVVTGNTFSGDSAGDKGGGVYVSDGGSATIINNTVTDNAAAYCAGGIGLTGVNPPTVVSQNTIELNHASLGGGLLCYYADITINHNMVANNTASHAAGIGCWHSSPTIDSCNVLNNIGDGIYCDSASTPMINWNNICGNTPYGVCNEWTSVTVNAENNWWDHSTGPYHSTGNPTGQGDSVGDYVDFDPWLPDSVQGIGIEETHELVIESQHLGITMPTILSDALLPFTVRQRCEMSIKLYDLVGRECWVAKRTTYESGSHTIDLPILSNGIYFIKFTADEQQETRKLLFVR